MSNLKLMLLFTLILSGSKDVSIFGFDDFAYNGIFYDNPAKEITLKFGGQVIEVDWNVVEDLYLEGPGLGIGLDSGTERAYINGSAFGLHSIAQEGSDAGDYKCGHLFARLLQEHPCSLFVHVPSEPTAQDIMVIKKAISRIRLCIRRYKWQNFRQ